MKTENYPGCRKVTIEHEGGTLTFQTKGSAKIDFFDNGVLEVRTFLDRPKVQQAKETSH